MKNDFVVDDGTNFGTWGDPTSQYMYSGVMVEGVLPYVNFTGHVGDFGGANGLLRKFIQNKVTTIDMDPTKKPDIVDDITQHHLPYDTAFCRYVTHYLTDKQVIDFTHDVNADTLIMVEFTNEDLISKYQNSVNETKNFRTYDQLRALLPDEQTTLVFSRHYVVTPDFYVNRLGLHGAVAHLETVNVFAITK
jgi:hypothetical protein